ncbi:MAG TPA: DUF1552 domain-containing protein [Kofleriaceae bacterium]
MAIKLDRRTVLKGIGGTILALPLLEAMTGRKSARGADPNIPKRYIVCFGGQSLGADNDPVHNYYVPNTVGANYDLKTALAPLANHNNIKNEITVVSGLKIPTAFDNGGTVPPGGRADDFHINSLSPLLSGTRTSDHKVHGPTSDQLVATAIAGTTTFKSLIYRVQASWYLDQSAPYGRDIISYRLNGTTPVAIPSTVSPRAAFDSLFTGFTPTDPAEAARRAFLLKQRKSVLDLVGHKTEKLLGVLGTSDKQRIQRHLDEVRDLERRISAIAPDGGGACQILPDVGTDPAVGGNQTVNGGTGFDVNAGYSNEDQRATLLVDLLHMAMVCDLTRVSTLQFTMAQSHMNMYPLINIPYDLHEIGHSSHGTMGVSQGIAWHMKHFARLVAKFRDTAEDVGTMLDSMAIVMLHEGGHGYDPSAAKQYSSHCTENMACLIAGRAGGLNPGRHVVATGMHPANVLVTAMNAVGVPTTALGEVSGSIPALTT